MPQTLRELRTEVEVLTRDVAELKRKHGLVPLDVGLEDGIPWGLVGTERPPLLSRLLGEGAVDAAAERDDADPIQRKALRGVPCLQDPRDPTATLAAWLPKGRLTPYLAARLNLDPAGSNSMPGGARRCAMCRAKTQQLGATAWGSSPPPCILLPWLSATPKEQTRRPTKTPRPGAESALLGSQDLLLAERLTAI
jgi:hypothetical protein